ncbi:indole-3-glycerol phosphate synthase TrpC [Amphibacillus indicireducens]|uniref:Indole-3-glycerol phosphate synthase n=1 Tax=Amphibacillus indicireducens TaxID=1076330 RepID=A0ABP7VZY0_9BACI
MTILEQILAVKKQEVTELKQTFDLAEHPRLTPICSFIERCQANDQLKVIAEFKRASPSKGTINAKLDPKEQAQIYQELGASMISVLTDRQFFQGSYQDLAQVKQTVELPILNKNFIIDEIQIDHAYSYGADLILLIVASLTEERLKQLYDHAKKLGLEVLVEVHDESELKAAQAIGAKLIGVNNRDLKTFKVDLAVTERLTQLINHDREILISESGLQTADDVARVKQAGAKAILVGETLMRSADLEKTFQDMLK